MTDLTAFHADIQAILEQARGQARSAVNSAMVEAYWLVGRRIVLEEQRGSERAAYGEQLLVNLSRALSATLDTGVSHANPRNPRDFDRLNADEGILYTLCSKLSGSHTRVDGRGEAGPPSSRSDRTSK